MSPIDFDIGYLYYTLLHYSTFWGYAFIKQKHYFLPTKNNFIQKSTQNSSMKSWVSIVQKTQCDISESQIDGFYEITSYLSLREKVGQSSRSFSERLTHLRKTAIEYSFGSLTASVHLWFSENWRMPNW